MIQVKHGDCIQIQGHAPGLNAECRSCDWGGDVSDCVPVTIAITAGFQIPVGGCPQCGEPCNDPLVPDLDFMRVNYGNLQKAEQGARVGRELLAEEGVKLRSRVTTLEAEAADLRHKLRDAEDALAIQTRVAEEATARARKAEVEARRNA